MTKRKSAGVAITIFLHEARLSAAQSAPFDGFEGVSRLDKRMHALIPDWVGQADHHDVVDAGALAERRLDLGRIDVRPTGDDQVHSAVSKVKVPLFIEPTEVTDGGEAINSKRNRRG